MCYRYRPKSTQTRDEGCARGNVRISLFSRRAFPYLFIVLLLRPVIFLRFPLVLALVRCSGGGGCLKMILCVSVHQMLGNLFAYFGWGFATKLNFYIQLFRWWSIRSSCRFVHFTIRLLHLFMHRWRWEYTNDSIGRVTLVITNIVTICCYVVYL